MTGINLKTLTPDTSLPQDGFLFGADSQATANPSVYSTQAVATTLLGSTVLTGGPALTADAPVLNLTQTWNNNAVTFTGIKYNATNTNSAAASLLMDLQTGGNSRFKIGRDGTSFIGNPANYGNNFTSTGRIQGVYNGSLRSSISLQDGSGNDVSVVFGGANSSFTMMGTLGITFFTPMTNGVLKLGQADAAAPVAQTLSVQSVVASTGTNTAGAAFTINGSIGTGSGAGGSIIFQVAPANTGGGAGIQNVLATAMVIDSVKTVRLGTGYTVATLPAAGTAGRRTYVTDALAPVYLGTLTGGGAVVCPVFDNGTAWVSA